MHDRRIDGQPHIFGNAGGLYMNAMTWWDHETDSVWSQPWGQALKGSHQGTKLFLLPSQLTTWSNWKAEHPHTSLMVNDLSRMNWAVRFDPDFVIGLVLGDTSKAYYYEDVAAATAVNDHLGPTPVVVWAADNNFHAYVAQVNGRRLTFTATDDTLNDQETGSTWDISLGLAIAGPLKGKSLQPVPSLSAFDWAWVDFYPSSILYEPEVQ